QYPDASLPDRGDQDLAGWRMRRLPLAPGGLDLSFQLDNKPTRTRLIEGLDPAKRLIKDAELVLLPVRLTGNRAEFTVVVGGSRRPHAVCDRAIDRDHDRRNTILFQASCDDPERVVAQP